TEGEFSRYRLCRQKIKDRSSGTASSKAGSSIRTHPLGPEHVGRGFKIPLLYPSLPFLFHQVDQIVQIGLTKSTPDFVQVKINIGCQIRIDRSAGVLSELLAAQAAESMASPDLSNG